MISRLTIRPVRNAAKRPGYGEVGTALFMDALATRNVMAQ
jgi:hypothetical protein